MFLKSFLKALQVDPGYRLRSGVIFTVSLPARRYPALEACWAFQEALKARLEAVPGVRNVVLCSGLPNGQGRFMTTGAQLLPAAAARTTWPLLAMTGTAPGYFAQMGIPLLAGRDLQASDRPGSPLAAVISSKAARRLCPGGSPLGQRFQTGLGTPTAPDGLVFAVVGVCGDVVRGDVRAEAGPQCYFSLGQVPMRRLEVVLATDLSPEAIRPSVSAQVQAMDPRLRLRDYTSLEALNLKRLADLRRATWLLGLFGGLGLVLGLLGVASVVATQVARRTREIGLRMALGAGMGQVLGLFLGQAMAQVGAGVLLGAALSAALGRVLAARLFNTPAADPWVLATAGVAFCAAAALASLVPALRAARVDPAEALRQE